jgi:hypothetical protein
MDKNGSISTPGGKSHLPNISICSDEQVKYFLE